MAKFFKRLTVAFLFIFGFASGVSRAQEQLTITTYYPSPYGSYKQLKTEQFITKYADFDANSYNEPTVTPIPNDTPVVEGRMYYANDTDSFYFYNGTKWNKIYDSGDNANLGDFIKRGNYQIDGVAGNPTAWDRVRQWTQSSASLSVGGANNALLRVTTGRLGGLYLLEWGGDVEIDSASNLWLAIRLTMSKLGSGIVKVIDRINIAGTEDTDGCGVCAGGSPTYTTYSISPRQLLLIFNRQSTYEFYFEARRNGDDTRVRGRMIGTPNSGNFYLNVQKLFATD